MSEEKAHNIVVGVGSSKWAMPADCVPVVANFFDAIRRQGTPVGRDYDAGAWREINESDWQQSMEIEFSNTDVLPPKPEEKEATNEN